MRKSPNIIITGTPGVGKTTHCEALAERTGLRHLSVNQIVKEKECHEGWDEKFMSWIVDEDKLLDAIEPDALAGGCIIDWHACDLFPARWIDLVVVLRVDSTTLYDRLAARKYPEEKLQENLDSEIMEVLLQEARDSYVPEIVVELTSNSTDEMESNVDRIVSWFEQWKKDNNAEREDGDGGGEEGGKQTVDED
ncbi:putative pos9-activating factor fap7 protein [Eutypa lata UCREL1]|uniref:Adenylate kinase isoenzyme 6 homolog n=1 Tax=Eutypa lata (strain UCR-EL1) TaxID=1287681 RepID=M7S5X9_EUTLA|nr:putative pos9-activating factor fap7 protein [Eutypa lata UCREL1]